MTEKNPNEKKLTKINRMLKESYGYNNIVSMDSSVKRVKNLKNKAEQLKNKIMETEKFNRYHKNKDYNKSLLICEACDLVLNNKQYKSDIDEVKNRNTTGKKRTDMQESNSKEKRENSKIAHEDNKKKVVIPLSKDAANLYSKGTRWSTTMVGHKDIVILYVLMKNGDEKYAAAYSKKNDEFDYFDKTDEGMSESEFKKATGLDSNSLSKMVKSNMQESKQNKLNPKEKIIQLESLYESYVTKNGVDNKAKKLGQRITEMKKKVYEKDVGHKLKMKLKEDTEQAETIMAAQGLLDDILSHQAKLGELLNETLDNFVQKVNAEYTSETGDQVREKLSQALNNILDTIDESKNDFYDVVNMLSGDSESSETMMEPENDIGSLEDEEENEGSGESEDESMDFDFSDEDSEEESEKNSEDEEEKSDSEGEDEEGFDLDLSSDDFERKEES